MGLRPWRVFLRTGTWSGSETGDGTESASETEILENGQPPKVRRPNGEEIGINLLDTGDVVIGPVTPLNTLGGTALSTLRPSLANGATFYVRLQYTDGSNVLYRIIDVATDRAIHYTLTCKFQQALTSVP
jgi:hypothetical protein